MQVSKPNHLEYVKGKQTRNVSYSCTICNFKCETYPGLTTHKLQHDTEMYRCDDCTFTAPDMFKVTFHRATTKHNEPLTTNHIEQLLSKQQKRQQKTKS